MAGSCEYSAAPYLDRRAAIELHMKRGLRLRTAAQRPSAPLLGSCTSWLPLGGGVTLVTHQARGVEGSEAVQGRREREGSPSATLDPSGVVASDGHHHHHTHTFYQENPTSPSSLLPIPSQRLGLSDCTQENVSSLSQLPN